MNYLSGEIRLTNCFDLLDMRLRGVIYKLGYDQPTEIQRFAIPKILKKPHSNYLISAPTGSGKTEAVIFPLISKILNMDNPRGILVLYITPLRALNRDIFFRLFPILSKSLGISIDIRHGDTSAYVRGKQSRNPPLILVTTPETLQSVLAGRQLRKHLRNVKWVVIDEVHSLPDNKRGVQLALGLERLRILSPNFSIIALSATVRNGEDVLKFFSGGAGGIIIKSKKANKTYQVKLDTVKSELRSAPTTIKIGIQVRVEKIAQLINQYVLKEKGKVLIFTNTRDLAEILGMLLKKIANFPFAVHHSSLSKSIRLDVEHRFRSGDLKCVIATSSLELGIDIGEADLVIQVMSPRRAETAIQRIGRAGHLEERISRGIIIAATPDDAYEALSIISMIHRGELEAVDLLEQNLDVLAHQIVGICRDFLIDQQRYPTIDEVFRIVKKAWPYRNLQKEVFINLVNFLDNRCRLIRREGPFVRLRRGSIRYYFENISTIPSSSKYAVFDVSDDFKKIGELDEKYVLELSSGDVFILGGIPREILEIIPEERKLLVMNVHTEGKPPKWVGELLPVSWEVAQGVGRIRNLWTDIDSFEHEIRSNNNLTEQAKDWLLEIAKAYPKDRPVPNDKNMIIELDPIKNFVIIHSPFGTKVNKTLSILLAYLLLEDPTIPLISVESDAYRIRLSLYKNPYMLYKSVEKSIKSVLNDLMELVDDQKEFYEIIFEAIRTTHLKELQWPLIQVLKRFGILREDKSLTSKQIINLMNNYYDTPIFVETLNEYIQQNLDIRRAITVLRSLISGRINVWFVRGFSPLALAIPSPVNVAIKDIDVLIDSKYHERLLNKKVKYVCLRCGYEEISLAKEIITLCPQCQSTRITVTKHWDNSIREIIFKMQQGKKLNKEERERLHIAEALSRFLKVNGNLVSITVATTGVGLKLAVDLLKKYSTDVRSLIKVLRSKEALYYRTRAFWQIKDK